MYVQVSTICHSTLWTIYYYYVSEHQLPHVIDTSHTMPTTHANRGPMLLKLIHALGGSCTYSGPRLRFLALNQALSQGSQITCITCITGTRSGTGLGCQSPSRELCSGTLFWLRNLYPRSTQNTDDVFSIFSNSSVSCIISCYYIIEII